MVRQLTALKVLNFLGSILASFVLLVLLPIEARANSAAVQSFTYEGRLYDTAGNPLAESVNFRVQILNSASDCVLYEETQTFNLSSSNGRFALEVGSDVGAGKRTGDDPGFAMWQVFKNTGSLAVPAGVCPGTPFNPALGEKRKLRVFIDPASGPEEKLSPDQNITSAPSSLMSQSLQGIGADGFVQITGNITQSNLDDLSSEHTDLMDLAAGTSSLYMAAGSSVTTDDVFASDQMAVGTTTPAAGVELEIQDNDPTLRLEATDGGAGNMAIQFFDTAGTDQAQIMSTEGTAGLTFSTGGASALVLDGSQNAQFQASITVAGTIQGGVYSAAQETGTLLPALTTCGAGCAGTQWMNSDLSLLRYWDGAAVRSVGSFSGAETAGQVLTSNGPGNAPTFQAIDDTTKLSLDGSDTMAGDLNMGGNEITNLGSPVNAGDAVNKTYADSNLAGETLAAPTAGEDLQAIRWNNTAGNWEYFSPTAGTVSAVSATAPLASSGGATPDISLNFNDGLRNNGGNLEVNLSSDLTFSAGQVAIATDGVTSTHILDGTIEDIDINANADIARTKLADGTANMVLINDGTGSMSESATIDATELGFLNNVSSSIQTQLDGKEASLGFTPVNKAGDSMTGALAITGSADAVQLSAQAQAAQTANLFELKNSAGTPIFTVQADGTISAATDIASKNYVDTEIAGLTDNDTTYTADGEGIEVAAEEFSLELDGTTLSKSATGLKVNAIGSTEITDDSITNADINASAAIARSKVAAGTASRVLVNDGSGNLSESATIDATELGHLNGVSSNIQTQLDGKQTDLGYTPVDKAGDSMTGGLNMGAGNAMLSITDSEANPSFTFQDDTDTGVFSPAADEIAISTAGSEALRVDGSGNVGIGTSSPSDKFEVVDGTANGTAGKFVQTNVTNSNGVLIQTQTTGSGDIALGVSSNGGANSLLMVRNDGNLGIGTATPDTKLEVAGGIKIGTMAAGDCDAVGEAGRIRYNSGDLDYCDGSSWQTLGTAAGGEVNTAANVGTGTGLFRDKTGTTINLKSINAEAGGEISITANTDDITLDVVEGNLDITAIGGYDANDNIDHTSVDMIAGTGLTGGGDISSSRTFNVIGGDGITANADDITVNLDTDPGLEFNTGAIRVKTGAGLGRDSTGVFHTDTSSVADSDNANGVILQDITFDTFGHVQTVGTTDLDSRYYTETESDSTFVDASGDSMTGALAITGSADAVQLSAQANAAQTANLFELKNSAGTPIFTVQADGTISAATDIVDKDYVDTAIGGLTDNDTTYTADGEGIEVASEEFSLELDGTTLSKSATGLKVNTIGSSEITNDSITNDDINASAAIARSKIATGTANRVLVNDGSGNLSESATIDTTELGHLDGVSSNIQTQLDGKQASLGYTPVDVAGDTMTGALDMGAGAAQLSTTDSEATPAFTFQDDTNTGIFSPAADELAIGTGGVEALRIDSDGNVGIGTSVSSGILQTLSEKQVIFTRDDDDNLNRTALTLRRQRNGATPPGAAGFGPSLGFNVEGFTNGTSLRIGEIQSAWEGPQTNDTTDRDSFMSFSTMVDNAEVERMRIGSSGSVGIGTTAPDASALLDVSSTTKGFLPPRMTTAERDLVITPAEGLTVFNTTTDKLNVFAGGAWTEAGSGGGFGSGNSGFVGSLKYVSTANCRWSTTSGSYADYSADSDCSSPSTQGAGLQADSGKVPGIKFASLPAGRYQVTAMGAFIASTNCRYQISDGTNSFGYMNINSADSVRGNVLTGHVEYSSAQTNINIQVQARNSGSGNCDIAVESTQRIFEMLVTRIDGNGSAIELADGNGDTKVQVEKNADENIIRFDTAGSERMTIDAAGEVNMSGDLTANSFTGDGSALTNIGATAIADGSITLADTNFGSTNGINIPQLAADPGSPTAGQMYYNTSTNKMMIYNGSSFVEVGSGAGGGGGGLVLVESQTASNSSTIDFTTGIDSTYKSYVLKVSNMKAQTDDQRVYLQMSTDGGSSWVTAGSSYVGSADVNRSGTGSYVLNAGNSEITISGTDNFSRLGSAAGESFNSEILLYEPSDATTKTRIAWHSAHDSATGTSVSASGSGRHDTAAAVDGIRILMQSGNITSGTFELYGVGDSGGGGGASTLAALTDTTISSPINGQVLTHNGTNWINASVNAGAAKTIESGWPDRIKCTGSDHSLYLTHSSNHNTAGHYYVAGAPLDTAFITYDASGNYVGNTNFGGNVAAYIQDCVGTSITALYAANQAFNLVGGGLNTASTTSALESGWPDAIMCTDNADTSTPKQARPFHNVGNSSNSDDKVSYLAYDTGISIVFQNNGTYDSNVGGTNFTDCVGQSISQLVSSGQAKYFGNDIKATADADNDTKVMVEKNTDEDIIRFDTAGSERMTIDAAGEVNMTGDLTANSFTGDGSALTNIGATAIADGSITLADTNFGSTNGINIPQLAADPGSPTAGQMYYNTSTNKMMIYNGSSFVEVGSGAGVSSKIGFRVSNTSQSIPDNVQTQLNFATVEENNVLDGTLGANSYTVGTSEAGIWAIDANFMAAGAATAGNMVVVKLNGTAVSMGAAGGGTSLASRANTSIVMELVSGDVISWDGRHTLGSSTTPSGVSANYLSAYRIAGGGTFTTFQDDDGDTQIRLEASADEDIIRFDTAGSERMVIDAGGNVGIGTASPDNALHIEGTTYTASEARQVIHQNSILGAPELTLGKTRGSDTTIVQDGDRLGFISFKGSDGVDVESVSASIEGLVDGAPGADDMPGALRFMTSADGSAVPTERMRVDSTGNVGIGTTAPSAKFAVENTGAGLSFRVDDQASDTTSFIIGDDGKVLIGGNAPPTNRLQVTGAEANESIVISNTAASGTARVWANATGVSGDSQFLLRTQSGGSPHYWHIGSDVSDLNKLVIGQSTTNGASNAFAIDTAGNVGIGTVSPNSKLTVEGVMTLDHQASDPTGTAGYGSLYTKTDGSLYYRDGTGTVTDLLAGGGSGDFMADGSVPMTDNIRLNGNFLSNDGGDEGISVDNSGNVTVTGDLQMASGPYQIIGGNTGNPLSLIFNQGAAGFADIQNTCTAADCFAEWQAKNSGGNATVVGVTSTGFSSSWLSANANYLMGAGSEMNIVSRTASGPIRFLNGNATTPIERMRITSSGLVGIGETNPDSTLEINGTTRSVGTLTVAASGITPDIAANTATNVGLRATPNGTVQIVKNANVPLQINRTGADGTLIQLRAQGNVEGSISIAGTTVSYNAFTGSHFASLPEPIDRGLLVEIQGNPEFRDDDPSSEPLYDGQLSSKENSPAILGAFLALNESTKPFDGRDNPYQIMAVGNGDVWVVDNGHDIKVGDYLISSSTPGHAEVDVGKHEVAHIIAKAGQNIDWSQVNDYTEDGKKRVKMTVTFEQFDKVYRSSRSKDWEDSLEREVASLKAENSKMKAKNAELEERLENETDQLKKRLERLEKLLGQ